jgi:hypothetical protein
LRSKGHTDNVTSLAVLGEDANDGLLASASDDGTVIVWGIVKTVL